MRYIAAFDGASIDVTTANADVMKNLLAESTTMGTKTIFNIEQEKALISYILQASDINYGISLMELHKLAYEVKHDAWKKSNIGVTFDLHHVPLLVDQCLDVMLTPKTIKSGFRTTGIYPFNPQIFTEVDFVASELSGENLFGDEEKDADNQRRVLASGDAIVTAAIEEVSTSEASTSAPA
ncbi:uncharacterized protein LOC120781655 [Bactrocera tryoni]|uniref:uncharacterized protein LOC120781655 n=1 Tax=Bactrocera tryoni TaxID=59916 RepID=UPI001A95FDD7|nr:uncharacterized protein LOC120781655 [Bactrocera tryoni]